MRSAIIISYYYFKRKKGGGREDANRLKGKVRELSDSSAHFRRRHFCAHQLLFACVCKLETHPIVLKKKAAHRLKKNHDIPYFNQFL